MADRLTDAELIERLKSTAKLGPGAASRAAGISDSQWRTSIHQAKKRGLTVKTIVVNEEDRLRAQVKILEKTIENTQKDNLTADSLRKEIYGLSKTEPKPLPWLAKAAKHPTDTTFSVPVTMWSDWHWGEKVRPEEMAGVNEFNRKIAKQRLKKLVGSIVNLTDNHMGKLQVPGIVVCLGGDMISGDIHEELQDTNDGYTQEIMLELQDELVTALTVMADHYGKVFVPCVVGNHGRMSHKPRAKGRVFTSFEWNLYNQLERHFRNDKRFRFLIPSETDAPFTVLGHRFHLTHGDSLGVRGGDGIIGCIGPIARGAMKVGRSEAQIGRDFDTLIMGHWHTYIPRGDAAPVIVNGTLKGYDEYARIFLRVPYTRPSQALWFVHAKYGITAQWPIFLDDRRVSADSADWVRFEQRR